MQKLQPLTPNSKARIVTQLREFGNKVAMVDYLIQAVEQGLIFPEPMNSKLSGLQQAWITFKDDVTVREHIHNAIRSYCVDDGVTAFRALLEKSSESVEWKSGVIRFLARQLQLDTPEQYLIEAQVHHGKTYWRVINQQHQVLYDRATHRGSSFQFDPEQSWQLSVADFLIFKNSGKRTNNMTVSEACFIEDYGDQFKEEGKELYQKLQRMGVINSKQRVSMGFRLLSGDELIPNAGGVKKHQVQDSVIASLYALLDNEELAENIMVNGQVVFSKFRQELSRKSAAKTGRVTNDERDNSYYSTRLWDVGIYKDLRAYYTAADVEQALECEHVPSRAAIKEHASAQKLKLEEETAALDRCKKQQEKLLKKKVSDYRDKHHPGMALRSKVRETIYAKFPGEAGKIGEIAH
ncbi:MAG: hypothetical protein KDH94_07970, partial [Coxiellaceae bacterium]|nr:hypothetical protein [Coxiellaceae bacterium]